MVNFPIISRDSRPFTTVTSSRKVRELEQRRAGQFKRRRRGATWNILHLPRDRARRLLYWRVKKLSARLPELSSETRGNFNKVKQTAVFKFGICTTLENLSQWGETFSIERDFDLITDYQEVIAKSKYEIRVSGKIEQRHDARTQV